MNHDPINEASRRSTFMFCVSSYSYSSLNRRLCTVFENEQKMSHLNFHSKTFAFLVNFFNYLNFLAPKIIKTAQQIKCWNLSIFGTKIEIRIFDLSSIRSEKVEKMRFFE